ncbi:hypothetical protein [uncultured Ruminococcus sp.]|nr:hypothetical protein [uncultured Ruminococcus sp.]
MKEFIPRVKESLLLSPDGTINAHIDIDEDSIGVCSNSVEVCLY